MCSPKPVDRDGRTEDAALSVQVVHVSMARSPGKVNLTAWSRNNFVSQTLV